MGVSFQSINTGLPPNIVDQLIEAERMPLKAIEEKKGKVQEKLKLVDDLTSKVRDINSGLRELASTKGFDAIKLETGDPNVVAGTVEPGVGKTGTYMVEVMELAQKTSAASNGFPDRDKTQVGVGYIKAIDARGEKKQLFVDGSNNTLDGIAKLINRSELGVKAGVIKDPSEKDSPYRLILSGSGVGEGGNLEFPTFYFLDGDQDFYLDKESEARNGRVKIDGVEFQIDDNKLKDVIPGVTLDLRQPNPGHPIHVTVSEDKGTITGKIKEFIDKVNGVLSFIQSQNNLNEKSDTTKTLGGDSILRNIETRFRSNLQDPMYGVAGSVKYLNQVGITFNRAGMLEFNEEKFNAMVASNLADVQEYFVGDRFTYGLVPRFTQTLNSLLDPSVGPLPNRSRGFRSNITQFDQQIETKERYLQRREQQLKSQFANLESTMSKMKSQGAALQAKLGGGDVGGFNLAGGKVGG